MRIIKKLLDAANRLRRTAVVDDGFPEIMHAFDSELQHMTKLDFPKIVCLCGSTRFKQQFIQTNEDLTNKGEIVLTVGAFKPLPNQKGALDELHKRKIDMCDYVLVINVDNYVGDSTRSEIAYAEERGVEVRYYLPLMPATTQEN